MFKTEQPSFLFERSAAIFESHCGAVEQTWLASGKVECYHFGAFPDTSSVVDTRSKVCGLKIGILLNDMKSVRIPRSHAVAVQNADVASSEDDAST